MPVSGTNETRTGKEIEDYLNVYDLLEANFGKPNVHQGILIDELRKITDVYKISFKQLPKVMWNIDSTTVVHHFRDYWGIIPDTYLSFSKKI